MRVAVVTQYFPNSIQPWAGHSAFQTLRVLARMCDLHVFYPEATYPALLKPRTHVGAPLDRTWQPRDVAVSYIPYMVLPVVSRPLNGFTIARALLPSVRRFAPDLLLNYVVYPDGYAAVRIAAALHVPVVLTAIGSDLNRISDPLCVALTRSALRHADGVTTVSGDLARTAHRLGAQPERTWPILNGCDTAIFHARDRATARRALELDPDTAPAADTKIVLYVGRLDVRKGLMELIDAAAALRQQMPGLRTYLVGDGPDKPLLQQAIARHAASESITLIAPCPTDQVALWMAAADLVTLPSYAEGCPNVVIEALSSGRPVVATHVGGIPELMDEASGRLVPPKDADALASGLREVLLQAWNADAISSRHSRGWTDVANDLYGILDTTLRRHTAAGHAGILRA